MRTSLWRTVGRRGASLALSSAVLSSSLIAAAPPVAAADSWTFVQTQRVNGLTLEFGTDTFATQNAFGGAFAGGTAQTMMQSALAASVSDGSTSWLLEMPDLSDLSGTSDPDFHIGVINAVPAAPGAGNPATYDGASDLDWWYTPDASDVAADGSAIHQLVASFAAKVLTAGPAAIRVTTTLAGRPATLAMSAARVTASAGDPSQPLQSTNGLPPGHLPEENLPDSLTSFETMSSGKLAGRVSARSLADVPIPASLTGGGLMTCSENYTVANSLLDAIVSGCHVLFTTEIRATQPDTVDPAIGSGAYAFTADPTSRQVSGCTHDGVAAALDDCLGAAAYSTYFQFTTDRVIDLASRVLAPTFNVADAASAGPTSVAVTFDAPPDAAQAASLANYSVPGLTLSGTPTLSANTVTITTSTQAAQDYTVTVSNVTRASDAEPLTIDAATFTGIPALAPPQAGVSPSSLSFGNVAVGSPSASQQVTVTNTATAGAADLHIGQLGTVGANASSFGLGADQCSNASLAPGASCTLLVTFLPTARGSASATLQIPDDAADSPQSVALTGTGVAPVAEVTPSSVDFGTVDVGSTSMPRTVTITNTGDAGQALVFSAATITGANAADFKFVSEHCVTTGQLASGSSCTIDLSFTPSASGSRSATLSIGDNAADSPQTVSLTGAGGTPSADLAVSISASLTKAKGASALRYTITARNAGPSTATGILINDALSSETTFVSATVAQGTCVTPVQGASGVVSCSFASLDSGSSSEVQVVVTVIARKTSITNSVTVSATTPDPNLVNNTASITTRVK